MIKGNSEWWTQRGCTTNNQMKVLLDKCLETNKRIGLISAVGMPKIAQLKLKWIETHYGVKLEDFCSSTAEAKVDVIEAIINAFEYKPEEILFIDDLYSNIMNIATLGVNAISCLEAVNFVNSLR